MWKYIPKDKCIEFILSLNLINNSWDNEEKIRCIYALSNKTEKHYKKFLIPKRNGEYREILEPDYLLKDIQRKIY